MRLPGPERRPDQMREAGLEGVRTTHMSQFKPNGSPTSIGDSPSVSDGAVNGASLANVVSLHIEGRRQQALQEIERVLEGGQLTAEVYSAKAHIQYELELYDSAAITYEAMLV